MTGRELREWQRWRNQKPSEGILPRCGLCRRIRFRRSPLVTGDGMMTIKVCAECKPVVIAADIGGVCQAVEDQFSQAWSTMTRCTA